MGKNDNLHSRNFNPAKEESKKRKAQGKTEKFQSKGGVKAKSVHRVARREGRGPTQTASGVLVGVTAALFLAAIVLYIVTSFTNDGKEGKA